MNSTPEPRRSIADVVRNQLFDLTGSNAELTVPLEQAASRIAVAVQAHTGIWGPAEVGEDSDVRSVALGARVEGRKVAIDPTTLLGLLDSAAAPSAGVA